MARCRIGTRRRLGILLLCGVAVTISISVPYLTFYKWCDTSTMVKKSNSYTIMEPVSSIFKRKNTESMKSLTKSCTMRMQPLRPAILRHGMWYLTKHLEKNQSSLEIRSFGAYVDTRNESVLIRVFSVSNTDINVPVYCQLWYTGVGAAVVAKAIVEDTGRGLKVKDFFFQERMYTCHSPSGVFHYPEAASLAFAPCDDDRKASSMPVHVPPRMNITHDIGLCTAVTYGSVNALKLLEWIEFNRILGITEINFYVNQLNDKAEEVLRYYKKLGIVRVRPIEPPTDNYCHWCLKLAAIAVLNDCMYKNMHQYRYLVVKDIDEIIIPKRHNTLNDLLRHLDVFYPCPSYMFNNAYFFLELPSAFPQNKSDIATTLITMAKVNRLMPSKPGYATKSIINPRSCVVMQNHYCMKRMADVSKKYWATVVKENLGLVHHYKKCHYETSECKRLTSTFYKDISALKFRNNLVSKVQDALANLSQSIQQDAK